jgi:hypothetical protein
MMTISPTAIVIAAWMIPLLGFLWITNPKHRRTRRALQPLLTFLVGAAVRVGLID